MKAIHIRDGAQETINLNNPRRPLVVFFILMPVAILLTIATIMLLHRVTGLFMVMSGIVVLTLGWLAVTALETLCETRIMLQPDALTVVRLLGRESYPWSDIQHVKIVPAARTFADDPAREDGAYVGLGIFLASKAKQRGEHGDADAMLWSAAGQYTEDFMKMRDTINAYKARLAGRGAAPIKRLGVANPRRSGEFRKRPAAETTA
jgi:hypothetical protein